VVPLGALQSELDSIALDNPAARNAKPDQLVDNHLAEELECGGFIQRLYP
jgi:hypothetical protein